MFAFSVRAASISPTSMKVSVPFCSVMYALPPRTSYFDSATSFEPSFR